MNATNQHLASNRPHHAVLIQVLVPLAVASRGKTCDVLFCFTSSTMHGYIRVRARAYAHVHTCVRAHAHTRAHVFMKYTLTHTHTYTHIQIQIHTHILHIDVAALAGKALAMLSWTRSIATAARQ
jgi:hypothetical protein